MYADPTIRCQNNWPYFHHWNWPPGSVCWHINVRNSAFHTSVQHLMGVSWLFQSGFSNSCAFPIHKPETIERSRHFKHFSGTEVAWVYWVTREHCPAWPVKWMCLERLYIDIPWTQMTLVLIGKGLVLRGWPSKIEVIWVPGTSHPSSSGSWWLVTATSGSISHLKLQLFYTSFRKRNFWHLLPLLTTHCL